MPLLKRITTALKALRQLGLRPVALNAAYRLELASGYLRFVTRRPPDWRLVDFHPVFHMPAIEDLQRLLGERQGDLLKEADEIVSGQARLFGAEPAPLNLAPSGSMKHWTACEDGTFAGQDIKFTWEPGRFGWAFILGRAYHLSGDERYPQAFWQHAETFLDANPPYYGPHWASGQEVALRMAALAFAAQVFSGSKHTTAQRFERLAQVMAASAARIPPTLIYARSQNNNHLLTEALGLYLAAVCLPGLPQAAGWRELGWRWFNHGIQAQIAEDGAYIQQSTNYHRLMLHAALLFASLATGAGQPLPQETLRKLAASARWLRNMIDPASRRVPNLGPNDGANILPLAACPFEDYRPVVQAASKVFLGEAPFAPGPWDELGSWLHPAMNLSETNGASSQVARESWAYLRAAHFTARPGHADQLHLDLWWRGLNLAQDAGTYLYNADPPWDNRLAGTAVHNTIMINGQDQMVRAGRFLWLDWAQARLVENNCLSAEHYGYARLGVIHRREAHREEAGWSVVDHLLPAGAKSTGPFEARLHWMLPDWPFEVEQSQAGVIIKVRSPYGWVTLRLMERSGLPFLMQLARAGVRVFGEGEVLPISGWVSPTYGVKIPALSFAVTIKGGLPIEILSEWRFPSNLES